MRGRQNSKNPLYGAKANSFRSRRIKRVYLTSPEYILLYRENDWEGLYHQQNLLRYQTPRLSARNALSAIGMGSAYIEADDDWLSSNNYSTFPMSLAGIGIKTRDTKPQNVAPGCPLLVQCGQAEVIYYKGARHIHSGQKLTALEVLSSFACNVKRLEAPSKWGKTWVEKLPDLLPA
jgi:hypothetical protein